MRIFLAVPDSKPFIKIIQEENGENILFSFAFVKSIDKVKKLFGDYNPKNIIVDSGAFSVWSKGDFIDIDAYAEFCKEVKAFFLPETDISFVNLDVLPGQFGRIPTEQEREDSARQGWENMLYLESKGLKVIPVFHQYESFDWLHKMMQHTDYIGISPANDASSVSKQSWLKNVFMITRDKIKTHGFAVTGYQQIITYPFFSVDSSSWASGARFARIPLIINGKIKSFNFKHKEDLMKYWNYLPDHAKNILESYFDRIRIGVISFIQLQKFITELWSKRGINW